jgi:adenine-specific DNA methylase
MHTFIKIQYVFSNMGEEDNPLSDRSDKKLTAKEAYELTEEKGHTGSQVAEAYNVSPSWVSQQKSDYANARQEGYESGKDDVSPNDFERDTLLEAIGDEKSDKDITSKCPSCGDVIPTPDEAGESDCPECGVTLNWSEDEI